MSLACLVLIAFLTIRTSPSDQKPPPPLQSFVRSAAKPAAKESTAKVPLASRRVVVNEPAIRVNVTPGGADSFQLEVRGHYRMVSLSDDEKPQANFDSGSVKVTPTKHGLKCGTHEYACRQLEIIPSQSPAIRVNGHLYRGVVRLYRRTDGKVSAVNVLPVEEYLASVVDSEMPAKFPGEARKAQAVVARTYALYQAQQADSLAVYDLLSSQRSQKYLGVEYRDATGRRLAGESESSRRAVASTRGVVCQSGGKLFCTYYSAVCGGRTVEGKLVFKDAIDCLAPVDCEWCRESPHFRWTAEIDRTAFQKRALEPVSRGALSDIRSIHQPVEVGRGSIPRFEIHHGTRVATVTGIDLRERMPTGLLASPHFRIDLEPSRVTFTGRGHGHGVGFCQWGAKGQADSGRPYDQIVLHYYPGAELVTLDY
ncbi:SpoIID/LytB domain-containing protein [Schlesneria paludicola]|uniref:SpoIID/LytB domain-containing protein n=1 Tax=Schlesneria paludicola TaxID=360056 RepID=UPI0012F9832E|nr:SpoIID/LytB domain-containing protein [Schlesneria paludicola]